MEISVTPGKLTIDQTQAWEELDRKHVFKRIEEAAQQGHEDVMEGIARTAEEGDVSFFCSTRYSLHYILMPLLCGFFNSLENMLSV